MSATTTALQSVLSALGGSSGIDVTQAVNAIITADRAPETQWQAQQATLATQTSALNQLDTDSSSLSDVLSSLQSASSGLSSVSATSSNSSVVTASVADGTSISNHTVVVNSLATTGSWYSDEEPSASSTISGSFNITSGGSTTTINIGSNNNTLSSLASSINSQSLGVTASVVTDSNGARLSLVANASGSAADFSVSQASGLGFTQAQAGANASLTVDGVPISSASNTVSGAVSGVTLNLQSASPGTTVNLSLAPDTSDITSTVQSFISAYNTLIGNLNTDVAYNQSTSAAGPLQSDSAAQSFYSDLLSAVNFSGGSGSVTSLNDLGITANNDGTLSLNTTTLQNAIQTNPTGVATFFQGATGSGGTGGFASSLTSTLSTYTDPSVGAFSVDLQSIAAENQDLTDQTNTLELYISSQQTILTQEYNNADIAIQQLPQQIQNTDALLGLTQNKNS